MPRFYFHVFNDVVAMDEEGIELPDLATAREQAMDAAREMVCEAINKGHLNLDYRIEVTDEGGETLTIVSYRDAFTMTGEMPKPEQPA
ncbi:MAG: hypothetical protein QOH81_2038 [Sphingomonadales bacterium]|jgi:hypothetical protein|nr:hypothetical protein [Sphingomonadales bacterium]